MTDRAATPETLADVVFGPLSQPFPAAVQGLLYPDRPTTPNDPRLLHDLTDARYAKRFAEAFGYELKYDHRRGCWRRFNGTRWIAGDSAAVAAAVSFAKIRQADALQIVDRSAREQAVVHAIRAEARGAIDNTLSLARHLDPMCDAGADWDSDPWLLGCSNGVVDLRTGCLRPASAAHKITMLAGPPFEPDADAPRFRRFLEEVFDGDGSLIEYVP